ncbi:MAG: tRNA lysidine(34) synthetase TilS [Candidatus Neomarinimicrobiota bacterium]
MYRPSLLEPVFRRWEIPLRGTHFLVAYSGGLDSSVLARSMAELAEVHDFSVTLGHVNHHLRVDSDLDESFCRENGTRWGLPFHTTSLDPSLRGKASLEGWARNERYAALEEMRGAVGAHWLLTAHHADDQAETVLMRLMQRSRFLTLAGIRPRRGNLLRPLLDFPREALARWASDEGLTWREDPSNSDPRLLRNRLRHTVMPEIFDDSGNGQATLRDLARLAQSYEASCAAAAEKLAGLATPGALRGTVRLPVEPILAAEEDTFRLALRMVVDQHLGTTMELSSAFWQNFRQFVRAASGGKVFELPAEVRVLRDRKQMIFYTSDLARPPGERPLKAGTTRWGYHSFRAARVDGAGTGLDLRVRSWRAGDRATVAPGRSPRLISDIFINSRLNRLEKIHWPLVVSRDDRIVWVPGLGIPRQSLALPEWNITWRTQIHRN